MSPAPVPRMHGLTHAHGGPDPAGFAYEDVGPGASGFEWALAERISPLAITSAGGNTYFDLTTFYSSGGSSFASAIAASLNGISIQQPGLYRLHFDVLMIGNSITAPTGVQAKLSYTGGGGSFNESSWAPGRVDTYGVVTLGAPTRATWELFRTVLYNYPETGSYPATRITLGAAHNGSASINAYGSLFIERIGDPVPGGIS